MQEKTGVTSNKIILGLTGLYCSGKSTVEKFLIKKFGYSVLDVDKTGHQALEIKKNEIKKKFGAEVLTPENNIDRKKLAQMVFHNKKKLAQLNTIVHPVMKQIISQSIKESNESRICINAALLFELGLDQYCHKILFIKTSFPIILKRALKRDNRSLFQILRIISLQKSVKLAKKSSKKTDIYYIKNNKNQKNLLEQLNKLSI
jgi:dephospho-CoA kinase